MNPLERPSPPARHLTWTRLRPALRGAACGLAFVALALLLTGCGGHRTALLPGRHQVENAFLWSPVLPPTVKRVLVLPLTTDPNASAPLPWIRTLETTVETELQKTRKLEVVRCPPELLRSIARQLALDATDPLPANLLQDLRRNSGCDAVLFCRVTVCRGYAPLALGWRMRLVTAPDGRTLWAADEMFDAAETPVAADASNYAAGTDWGRSDDGWRIRHAPSQFAAYTVSRLLATLPER